MHPSSIRISLGGTLPSDGHEVDVQLQSSVFNQDISGWDTSQVTDMMAMFLTSDFNGDISEVGHFPSEEHEAMFARASVFNGDISGWDTSQVTDMAQMFAPPSIRIFLGGTPPK